MKQFNLTMSSRGLTAGSIFSIFLLSITSAHAKAPESTISFDFEKMNITSKGIYSPTNGKQTLDTLNAEISARENGIVNIKKYLNESCRDINSPTLNLHPEFETNFHSQGTEIYSDGSLQVSLMASYKSVFQYKSSSALKTENGESIVFSLPSSIPITSLKCGSPALSFSNKSGQFVSIQIIPAKYQKEIAPTEKLIKLVFDAQKKALVVANADDALLLKTANFTFNENGTTFLPVTVHSKH